MKNRLFAAVLIGAGVMLMATPAWATPGNADNVTLCHRTDADNNPYVQITVDPDAVFKQGHDGHDGPVWNPTLKPSHTKWGDIIPPFDYTAKHGHTTTQGHYDGKNWNSDGQAIYDNGCTVPTPPSPTPSASSTPSETPSHTQTPSESPSESSSPSDTPSASPSTSPTRSEIPLPPPFPTLPPATSTSSPSPSPSVTVSPTHSTRPPIVCAGCPTPPPPPSPPPLPYTGLPVLPLVASGAGMVLLGLALLRRRTL